MSQRLLSLVQLFPAESVRPPPETHPSCPPWVGGAGRSGWARGGGSTTRQVLQLITRSTQPGQHQGEAPGAAVSSSKPAAILSNSKLDEK